MRDNDILDSDVSLDELANLTKNYSGAELSGVVKAASSYAFSRHTKVSRSAKSTCLCTYGDFRSAR